MGRQITRHPKIYQGPETEKPRLWHCWVTVGRKPTGKLDRRHIKASTRERVEELLDEAIASMDRRTGSAVAVDTVAGWLRHWLEHIVKPNLGYKTHEGYRTVVERHIIPAIGDRRLSGTRARLEPEHLDQLYKALRGKLAPSYVRKIHHILSKSMADAVLRGRAARNVCDMVNKPRARRVKVKAHSLGVVQEIMQAVVDDDWAARWLIGILYGARQGEALGIHWRGDDEVSRFDLDADPPMLHLVRQVQRRTWEHGCTDPARCVVQLDPARCRVKPCPPRYTHGCENPTGCKKLAHFCPARQQAPGCSRHRGKDGCPPLCRPECTGHARWCPRRTGGGLVEVDLKSEKSVREFPIVTVLVDMLVAHRERQQRLCEQLGIEWDPEGLVFASAQGKPIDPRRDHERWEQLLVRAGVADGPLHGARHDAASVMIATGTDISIVQEVLGHTDIRTTRQYVDIANDLKKQAVERAAAAMFDGALAALLQPSKATMPHQR